MASSPISGRLAVVRDESTLSTLDEQSWRTIATWSGDDWAEAVAFGGDRLFWGGDDNVLRAMRLPSDRTATPSRISEHGGDVYAVAASRDGDVVASGGEADTVHLADMVLRHDVRVLTSLPDEVVALALSPDGRRLAIGTEDGTLDVRQVQRIEANGTSPLLGHSNGVENLAFWHDQLVSSGDDDRVLVWTLADGSNRPFERPGVHAALAAQGSTLAAAGSDGIALLSDDGTWARLETPVKDITGLAVSRDESRLAFVAKGGIVGLCPLVPRGRCIAWRGHRSIANAVAFSPDGSRLASAGDDPGVLLWSVAERSARNETDIGRLDDEGAVSLPGAVESFDIAFSHDGTRLAAAAHDSRVLVWEPSSKAPAQSLRGHTDRVYGVAFSPDDRFLASASKDSTIRVWETSTWTSRVLQAHIAGAYAVRFSPDGKLLASSSEDRTIRLWDTATWTEHGSRKPRFANAAGPSLLAAVCKATGLRLVDGLPTYARHDSECEQH